MNNTSSVWCRGVKATKSEYAKSDSILYNENNPKAMINKMENTYWASQVGSLVSLFIGKICRGKK